MIARCNSAGRPGLRWGEDVIPVHWIAHRRDDDDELVGYLVPQPGGTHLPVTVFGFALRHRARGTRQRDGWTRPG